MMVQEVNNVLMYSFQFIKDNYLFYIYTNIKPHLYLRWVDRDN